MHIILYNETKNVLLNVSSKYLYFWIRAEINQKENHSIHLTEAISGHLIFWTLVRK